MKNEKYDFDRQNERGHGRPKQVSVGILPDTGGVGKGRGVGRFHQDVRTGCDRFQPCRDLQ